MKKVEAKRVWLRLGVFRGGFSYDAALDVCTDELVKDTVVHSAIELFVTEGELLVRDGFNESLWYEFVKRPPAAMSPEFARFRVAHARWYAKHLEELTELLKGEGQERCLAKADLHRFNYLAAMDYASTDACNPEMALEMGVNAFRFWYVRAYYPEGAAALLKAINKVPGRQDTLKLKALTHAGIFLHAAGESRRGLAALEESLSMARLLGETKLEMVVLGNLGTCYKIDGSLNDALQYHLLALPLIRTHGNSTHLISSLITLAGIFLDLGKPEQALPYVDESLKLSTESGDKWAMGITLLNKGEYYLLIGESRLARQHLRRALEVAWEVRDVKIAMTTLCSLAKLAAESRSFSTAALLFGAADYAKEYACVRESAFDAELSEKVFTNVREALGEEQFSTAYATGKSMGLAEAVEFAISAR